MYIVIQYMLYFYVSVSNIVYHKYSRHSSMNLDELDQILKIF